MMTRPLTRRRFLTGCAGAGAAVACGAMGTAAAFAEGGRIGAAAQPESAQVHTICQACPNACGYTAWVVDGELGKTIGDAASPNAAGNLCARGYGFTQSASSSSNLKNPMRRKKDGSYKTISWDDALREIGDTVQGIIAASGAGSVALISEGSSSTASAYGRRFMHALGSSNAFIDDVTDNIAKAAAFTQVIGTSSYHADIANADLVLLIDTSYADITTPDLTAALRTASETGTKMIAIDPRLGTVASFASEWVAVNPGSELALLLAICNQLIRDGRYDRAFVAENATGFEEWSARIEGCTAAWAQDITGVASDRIASLAAELWEAAPRVAIQYENGSIGAASYVNSTETARAVCLLNMLLGSWGAEGGALLPFDYSAASFDAVLSKPARAAQGVSAAPTIVGFPLGQPFGASAAHAIELADQGIIRALFVVEADIAYDYASIPDVEGKLRNADLLVAICQQATQTSQLADYILPVCPYLESASLPVFCQGPRPAVSIAMPVLEADGSSNAKPIDEIICGLATACKIEGSFSFSMADAASLQLEQVGLTLEGLAQTGSGTIDGAHAARRTDWATPSGKIECMSAACERAGLPASPIWVPTREASDIAALLSDDMNLGQRNGTTLLVHGDTAETDQLEFHLITGQQSVLGSHGSNVEELMDIAEAYRLDSIWVNARVASLLGMSTGDAVIVRNDHGAHEATLFATERIAPTAVYLPSGFGRTAPRQQIANGKGVNPAMFCDAVVQPGYGTLCTQDACVQLQKAGE